MTNDSIVKIIEKWKSFWMNQTQNSEEDRQNYFNRAFGIDANMKYHLADLLWKEIEPIVEELTQKQESGHMIVEHGYRMAAEHKVKELEAHVERFCTLSNGLSMIFRTEDSGYDLDYAKKYAEKLYRFQCDIEVNK